MRVFGSWRLMAVVCALGLSCVMDGAEIRNVTAKQRFPWNGKVDITYTLTGDVTVGQPTWNPPVLSVTATNRVAGTSYTALTAALSGDTSVTEGVHHVVWDLNAQWIELRSDDVVFSVEYKNKFAMYCVIDLSAGANASSYPVTYMDTPPSGGFNMSEYKTTKLVLRLIGPGSFMMCGSYAVTLTKPFYCGVFEVTQKQYELVMGRNPSSYKGDMRPVETVSRDNSLTFVSELRSRTGLNFNLPTEAQWEYACRAGTGSAYNNGGDTEDDLKFLGRYSDNRSDGRGYSDAHTIVGSYLPNSWGLYDMHGNVWEWCLDRYGELTSDVVDPVGPNSGEHRVRRGGSWGFRASRCTSSYRSGVESSYGGGHDGGFRLVRTLSY